MKEVLKQIKNRRDSKYNWEYYNPILLEGETGYVLDNDSQYKLGDGIHTWNELPYRGFNGKIAQDLGKDSNTVVSQKRVTEEFEKQAQQINALENSKDVSDIVANKAELDAYDVTSLNKGAVIKVLTDESQGKQTTYYKLTAKDPKTWKFIGSLAATYTKPEIDDKFLANQTEINNMIPKSKITQNPGSEIDLVMSQKAVTDLLGQGYKYMGIADTTTPRPDPKSPVFYIANKKGVYSNFTPADPAIEMQEEGLAIIKWDGTKWGIEQSLSISSSAGERRDICSSQFKNLIDYGRTSRFPIAKSHTSNIVLYDFIEDGIFIGTDGIGQNNQKWCATCFLPIKPNTKFYKNNATAVALYNKEYNFVRYIPISDASFSTSADEIYFRATGTISNKNLLRINDDNSSYVKGEKLLSKEQVFGLIEELNTLTTDINNTTEEAINTKLLAELTDKALKEHKVGADKYIIPHISTNNLVIDDNIIEDIFINSSGVPQENIKWCSTYFLKVDVKPYYKSTSCSICLYDSNFIFTRFIQMSEKTFTPTSEEIYIRVSSTKEFRNTMKVVDKDIPYQKGERLLSPNQVVGLLQIYNYVQSIEDLHIENLGQSKIYNNFDYKSDKGGAIINRQGTSITPRMKINADSIYLSQIPSKAIWWDENFKFIKYTTNLALVSGAKYVAFVYLTTNVQNPQNITCKGLLYREDSYRERRGERYVYSVGYGKEFADILLALKFGGENSIIEVENGIYDLEAEYKAFYGNDYFEKYSGYLAIHGASPEAIADPFSAGLFLQNNVDLIGLGGNVELIFPYSGGNVKVANYWTPINTSQNNRCENFTINLTLPNTRYHIHDDFARLEGINIFKNLTLLGNNSKMTSFGCGMGVANTYIIEDCRIDSGSESGISISYHNNSGAISKNKLIIKNTICNKGIWIKPLGDSTNITDVQVCGCKASSVTKQVVGSVDNMKIYQWNNVLENPYIE